MIRSHISGYTLIKKAHLKRSDSGNLKVRGKKRIYLTIINYKKLLWLYNSQGKQFKAENIK